MLSKDDLCREFWHRYCMYINIWIVRKIFQKENIESIHKKLQLQFLKKFVPFTQTCLYSKEPPSPPIFVFFEKFVSNPYAMLGKSQKYRVTFS